MPVELSADPRPDASPQAPSTFELSLAQRLAMVALGYIPLLHAASSLVAAAVVFRQFGIGWACAAWAATIYLLPPLAVAVARPRAYFQQSNYSVGSSEFLRWWYTAQWQVVFHRLPQLEEALRLVPGLYSTWLRLWGAKIGGLVYWSPGLNLYDRPFLEIGNRVVFGADTKLAPHFLARTAEGHMELVIAPIRIGAEAMIGGSTLLPAGVYVGPGEQTPGGRPMAPFSRFENGRHLRTTRFHEGTNHAE